MMQPGWKSVILTLMLSLLQRWSGAAAVPTSVGKVDILPQEVLFQEDSLTVQVDTSRGPLRFSLTRVNSQRLRVDGGDGKNAESKLPGIQESAMFRDAAGNSFVFQSSRDGRLDVNAQLASGEVKKTRISRATGCLGSPCLNGGNCSQSTGECTCPSGWTGFNCELVASCRTSASLQCFNGVCVDGGGGAYKCQCTYGYTGARCDAYAFNCYSAPMSCQNQGICRSVYPPPASGNLYSCQCVSGYSGPRCEITPTQSSTCFPSDSRVILKDGTTVSMSQLRIGDHILTSDEHDGTARFSPVVAFLDHKPDVVTEYLGIATADNTSITLSALHLIAVMEGAATAFVHARRVKLADEILVHRDGAFVQQKVVAVDRTVMVGAFAPLTMTGTVVVDGALASCYAVVNSHHVGHLALAPLRWWSSMKELFLAVPGSDPDGVHLYAQWLYPIAESLQLVTI